MEDVMQTGSRDSRPDLAPRRTKTFWIFGGATATAAKLLKELPLC
jgi:hypothetical protein